MNVVWVKDQIMIGHVCVQLDIAGMDLLLVLRAFLDQLILVKIRHHVLHAQHVVLDIIERRHVQRRKTHSALHVQQTPILQKGQQWPRNARATQGTMAQVIHALPVLTTPTHRLVQR
jgi:hypothetical protein